MLTWSGSVRILERHRDGSRRLERLENLITDAGLNWVRDALVGARADLLIDELAWGGGATAPAPGDTALANELGRKVVTARAAGATTGEAVTTVLLHDHEANVQIEELGWFSDSILVARVLYSRLKDNSFSVQVDRTDLFARVS